MDTICASLYANAFMDHLEKIINKNGLNDLFAFLSKIYCQEQLQKIQQIEKKEKSAFASKEFALCHDLLYVTPILNKTSYSKSFCLLKSVLQRTKFQKFFLVLAFSEHL